MTGVFPMDDSWSGQRRARGIKGTTGRFPGESGRKLWEDSTRLSVRQLPAGVRYPPGKARGHPGAGCEVTDICGEGVLPIGKAGKDMASKYGPTGMYGYVSWEEPHCTREYMAALADGAKEPVWERVCRLGSKNAWVVHDTANDVYCCQSYWTIVSYKCGDTAVRLGTWSMSTTRHQSAFADWVYQQTK